MTGLRATIGAAVTFIHDPVPMRDRREAARARGHAFHDHVERIVREAARDPLDEIDWTRLGDAAERKPPSSPPLYNWATRFAWPRDGFGT